MIGIEPISADRSPVSYTRIQAPSRARRVLVISFDFPPRRTSAVYRMTGLTRSLPQLGWQPTVLTIRSETGDLEPKLLAKLPPDLQIVRTPYWQVNAWENRTHQTIRSAGGLQSAPDAPQDRQPLLDRCTRSVGRLLRSTLYFPDETVGWVPHGLSEAMKLHQREPFEAVYTTSPPRAALVIGLLFKAFTRIPWVCEFMDPWYPPEAPFRKKAEHWLHGKLLRNSNRVVVMTPQHAEDLSESFRIPKTKFIVVRNGFFEEDFAFLDSFQQNELLEPGYVHLSHFGTIYPENAGKFFPALAELVRESPEIKSRLRVNLGGHPSDDVLRWAHDDQLKDVIRLHGFIPQSEALRVMRASDCLLLFWGRPDFSRLAVAGKTYDYLRIGRPILAVTREGGMKDLVEEAHGCVVSPDDANAIKQALRDVICRQNNGSGNGRARPEFVAQFRWDRQAEHLARAFDEAVSDAR